MPECFVTLDKYKNDLARYVARDKLILERVGRFVEEISSDTACMRCMNGNTWLIRFQMISQMLRQPLDMWFTEQEWSQPVAASRDKYSSVADGVQTHLEFEGER